MSLRGLLATVAIATLTSFGAANATTFSVLFDDSGIGPDGTITPPLVGAGTFNTPDTLTAGGHDLNSLSFYSFTFTFANGATFTQADILTPLDGAAIGITDLFAGQRLVFTEAPGSADADGGPEHGALDLQNANGN